MHDGKCGVRCTGDSKSYFESTCGTRGGSTPDQSGTLFQNKRQNSKSEQPCVIGLELVTWEGMPSGV